MAWWESGRSQLRVDKLSTPAIAEPPYGRRIRGELDTIVQITALDIGAGTATQKLPNGEIVPMLAKHPENLVRVNVGDTVPVPYGESVALMVEPKARELKPLLPFYPLSIPTD